MSRAITPPDLLDTANYARTRATFCHDIGLCRHMRRIAVGPSVTFCFESYATLWLQVQERLHAGTGDAALLADVLAECNRLLPQGEELVATVESEVGGIAACAILRVGDTEIAGVAERETGRVGEAVCVRFAFTPDQIAAFRDETAEIVLSLAHPDYRHAAAIGGAVRDELADDFD